ncbi:MAG: hypothetical protein GXO79_04160 [Chlorobi bacterium]|nr:hypothetical protein [Chlorobiota bacterium]
MVPIVANKNQSFDAESFERYIIETTKMHKEQGRALAFAFIIYDFDNHTINQILKKEDYWSSLDKISGKFLSIFYINSQNEYYERRQNEIFQEELRQRNINAQKGYMSFLVPITKKPTPIDNAVGLIKKEFNIQNDLKLPAVLFFQTNDEDISDSFLITLKEEKLEDAFIELRDHIRNAVDSLSEVKSEYFGNHQEIFNLIRNGVESGRFNKFIKKNITSKIGIGTIISFIKLIAG